MGNKKAKPVPTELTDKQLQLLKANTGYNDYEIRQWHTGFLQDCPTGRLDRKTFTKVYSQLYPQGKADTYCKYAFDAFDKNDDGYITFDEFLLAVAASGQGSLDDRLDIAFDIYDISDDGLIDQKELAKLLSSMYDLVGENDRKGERDPKKRAADIIAQLDVSGDRKLTREEFIAGVKNDPYLRQILTPNA